MLARQAASIEFFLSGSDAPEPDGGPDDFLSRILIGTTGEPTSHGSSTPIAGFAVIQMSAGMIDLLYQTAKAVVLAWKPLDPPPGSAVAFSSRPEDTEDVLNKTSTTTDLLFDTLSTWLYEGLPRSRASKAPPVVYHGPLQVLDNGAERFVLAHEYGHALKDQLAADTTQSEPHPSRQDRELRADRFALRAVANSSALLDNLPANMALQGAILSMKAHEVLDEALQLARTGEISGSSRVSNTHPPFAARISLLKDIFTNSQADPGAGRKAVGGMMVPAETVDQIWARVAPMFRAQFRAGRQLHPIWEG
jgi:hypothetical protein